MFKMILKTTTVKKRSFWIRLWIYGHVVLSDMIDVKFERTVQNIANELGAEQILDKSPELLFCSESTMLS